MELDLAGIKNKNEYYTNHYFTSIFKDNAEDTISDWKKRAKEEEITEPWKLFRDTSRQYYRVRDRYLHTKGADASKEYIQEMAGLYLSAMGYGKPNNVIAEVADGITVPVYHEEVRSNGAPLLWAFLCTTEDKDEDILDGKIFAPDEDGDYEPSLGIINDEILSKLFFAGDEAPRWIILIGINQIALIDRNKWNEKRYLQFMLEDIFGRHEESAYMALSVLLHKESLCPTDGNSVLDTLDENSHKHSAGVSDALKFSLRESIEILGNEVIHDMKTRQGINLDENPVDAGELTLECLRYMYRFLFMLFIEARPELGYAPMKSQTYVQGYSLEGVRDVVDRVKEDSEIVSEGYYIDDTISELFDMLYKGYPENLEEYKKAIEQESLHDVFTIEALKAHIFDPEYTKLITNARLRNSAMLQIVELMSISRPQSRSERAGRISYSALGINQMGAVYEALLSYRGFIAEQKLFEVKKAGEKFNELDVGYFIPESELDNYTEDERVRYEKGEKKGQLRSYEKGTFIYRLAGREREKSASYYTPEVLTKCLVKYALKELLKDKTADEILHLTVCEPAMGSAAFLNEAINQLAEAYINKKQEELGETISFDERFQELQKVKMYIADNNVYGVDLNPVAVELAEVSLWLNTIYKGSYVPWFGTQLVNGNSLIGARRQVYYTSKLQNGKWYDEAPVRIMPGEKRKRTGVTSRVYHFLLGDPGMSNYNDKVIKSLEPDNIKKIKEWNKKFIDKYTDDEIDTLLRLSDVIDSLWEKTADLRKQVEKATSEPLSVYGHDEVDDSQHLTIREKDEIYKRLFKSEHMNNAGPYARLKAAMDYWCALWFWPIDKADLLPDRATFFMDMSLILEGGIASASSTSSVGQLSFVDAMGNALLDEEGKFQYLSEGTQLELAINKQYEGMGEVNLDDLRSVNKNPLSGERLALVAQIAEEQKFQHWELEFADLFDEKGGFDFIIGNPPYIKPKWNEYNVLSEVEPELYIKGFNSATSVSRINELLSDILIRNLYISEFINQVGTQNFLNSSLYGLLKGVSTNLSKNFVVNAIEWGNGSAVFSFIHPEGIYDEPGAGNLRRFLYKKLRYHFQFVNEKNLFSDVGHAYIFSLNIYSNGESDNFISISNLFAPSTIDECFDNNNLRNEVPGIKDGEGRWNIAGHPDRKVNIGLSELKVLSELFDDDGFADGARLPAIHLQSIISVLKKFGNQKKYIKELKDKNEISIQFMWHETYAQKDGTLVEQVHFPNDSIDTIYTGPLIGVCNPIQKTPRRVCKEKADYDVIDLTSVGGEYRPRSKYDIACSEAEYINRIPIMPWGVNYIDTYRIFCRKMLNVQQERTLMSCLAPVKVGHTNGVTGISFKDKKKAVLMVGQFASLPFDFFVKVLKKSNFYEDTLLRLPIVTRFEKQIIRRALLLNCINSAYSDLWNDLLVDFEYDQWAKEDNKLSKELFINADWNVETPARTEYERRELLVELDVLVSMALGLTLQELKTIYKIQFPVLQSYEEDTWYDAKGKIVFTNNRSLSGVGVDRKTWELIRKNKEGEVTISVEDDTLPGGLYNKQICYYAPFSKCNREEDYETVWNYFEEKFK